MFYINLNIYFSHISQQVFLKIFYCKNLVYFNHVLSRSIFRFYCIRVVHLICIYTEVPAMYTRPIHLLSLRKGGIMFLPALVCLSVCLLPR